MALMSWPDGDSVETDPRSDDPLYYYLRAGDWKSAIGFLVEPEQPVARTARVSLTVPSPYRARLDTLGDTGRAQLYSRVVDSLATRFSDWMEIVFTGTPAEDAVVLAEGLAAIGWLPRTTERSNELMFFRASK